MVLPSKRISAIALVALLLALPRSTPLRAQSGAALAAGGPGSTRPELELQTGHLGGAYGLAFSPDGKIIASAGTDSKVLLWDVASGAVVRVLAGHSGVVWSLAWSPDGSLLVSGAGDGKIRFWNPYTGALQRTLDSAAMSVAFSPDGKILASSFDHTVKLWDVATGAKLQELTGHGSGGLSLAFSPDGGRLAVGSPDWLPGERGELKLWDLKTAVALWSVALHDAPVYGVASVVFSPDGKTIVTGKATATRSAEPSIGEIHFWDARTGARQRSLSGHTGVVDGVAFTPDGQTLVSGGWDGTVRVWDARTGAALRTLTDPEDLDPGSVNAIALRRDGRIIAASYDGGHVKLWDARTGVLRRRLGWTDIIYSVAVSPDGKLIAGGTSHRTPPRVWDARTGALQWLPAGQKGPIASVAFSRDSRLLASAGKDGTVMLWDTKSRAEQLTVEGQQGENWVALSPDGQLLACPAPDNEYALWDVKTRERLRTLPGHNGRPGIAFSPDGKLVATCSNPAEDDKPAEVQLWDARSWERLCTLDSPPRNVAGLVFSPDSTLLATAGLSGVRLWDVRTGTLRRSLEPSPPFSGGSALAFSPDGKILASSIDNNVIRLWQVESGQLLRTLTRDSYLGTNSVSFSSDGGRLSSVGTDHTLKIWEVNTGRLLATLLALPPNGSDDLSSDWAAITPEGYYDASPGAARYLRWRIDADLFPVEAYEHRFHRPDLLRRALAGAVLAETPELQQFEAGRAIPPQVVFLQPGEGHPIRGSLLPVELAVTDDHPGARVQLLVNGRAVVLRPISLDGKPITVGGKPITVGGKLIALGSKPIVIGSKPIIVGGKPVPLAHHFLQRFRALVPLPVGERQFTLRAIATDRDALIGWADLHLARTGVVPVPGDLYVLAVGISHYRNPHYNLRYAAADAAAFARLWPGMAGHLYRRVHVRQLTDAQATTAAVRAALAAQMAQASGKDSVALFLSGHGVEADEGEFYFATSDIDASSRERIQATALPWTLFQETLAQVKAKRVFLFLDACHSGSALGEQQATNEQLAEAMVRRGGVLVFASSRAGEYSYEDTALHHGAFTAALLEGIGEGKADLTIGGKRDGRITAEELLTYLRIRVPQLTQNRQTPTCPLLYDFGEEFLLARAR